jgi:hypothetical protein
MGDQNGGDARSGWWGGRTAKRRKGYWGLDKNSSALLVGLLNDDFFT